MTGLNRRSGCMAVGVGVLRVANPDRSVAPTFLTRTAVEADPDTHAGLLDFRNPGNVWPCQVDPPGSGW